MSIRKASSSRKKVILKELKGARKLLYFASAALFVLSLWHSYSTVQVHKEYQRSLMDSVTNQVLNEYENHLLQLRQKIDDFQWRNQAQFMHVYRQGELAAEEDYMALLRSMREAIPDLRLFSIVDSQGNNVLKHITGDFLPNCKEEIHTTLEENGQEQLFLHRSSSSVHYDLIQPLLGAQKILYIFVAFEPTVFKSILKKYKLPEQELFLLRKDKIGKVELNVSKDNSDSFNDFDMTESEVAEFSFKKSIPNTRWDIAIRLAPNYEQQLQFDNYSRSLLLWFLFSVILIVSYFSLKKKAVSQSLTLKQLEHNKQHDNLTGLLNRTAFVEHFELKLPEITSGQGAAFILDLDKFQVFNNAVGFAKGDLALKHITDLIKELIPKDVRFARIDSDKFAILSTKILHSETLDFAHKVRSEVENADFSELDEAYTLTCCVGVVNVDKDITDGEHVMSSLELTNKLAKSKGRNQVLLYQSDDPELLQHAGEMDIYHTVQSALNESTFKLFRQEIRSTLPNQDYKVFEVLVRMTDSTGKMISPAIFIPVAEQHSLAVDLDKWVIEKTLKELASNSSKDQYCINLSGLTLADKEMPDFVRSAIKQAGVDPTLITFEITETYAITHLDSAIRFLEEITQLGCRFALDDFGSGLSSFSYLQKLPVQKLKIDGVFIKNITENPRNQAFVKTMVTLAQSMEMQTVAEFVETQEEFEMLQSLGLDYCQGYFFHKPEPWVE